jgi:hypothetical protein
MHIPFITSFIIHWVTKELHDTLHKWPRWNPPLDSDSTSLRTCFLNFLPEFTRTTYPGNLYPIGLPNWLTQISPEQLTRSSPKCLIRALSHHINVYPVLYVHTRLNHLTRFFSRSDFYLPGLTRSYPTELPYPILSRSDFCLPDRTWPTYPILSRSDFLPA